MEESIARYAGAFLLGGEGWVFRLKTLKEARVVTKDALKESPDPPMDWGNGDLGFKAQWHNYDVIHYGAQGLPCDLEQAGRGRQREVVAWQ